MTTSTKTLHEERIEEPGKTISEEIAELVAQKLVSGQSVRVLYPDGSGRWYEPYTDTSGRLSFRLRVVGAFPEGQRP